MDQAIAKYYEAAKKEGKLVLYGVGNATLYNPVRDAFMKSFPGIQLEGVDQRGRESREKVFAEQQSKNYVADVVISGTDTQNELIQNGYIEPYQAAELANVIPELVPPDRQNNPRTVSIFTIAINTNLVQPDQEPKTWKDCSIRSGRASWRWTIRAAAAPAARSCRVWKCCTASTVDPKLAEQNLFFATQAGPLLDGSDRGEYAIFLSSNHTDVIAQRKAGAPIKQIKPSDGVGITPINQAPAQERAAPERGQAVDRVEPVRRRPDRCSPTGLRHGAQGAEAVGARGRPGRRQVPAARRRPRDIRQTRRPHQALGAHLLQLAARCRPMAAHRRTPEVAWLGGRYGAAPR